MNPENIEIIGCDEYPADASLKINGPPGTGKTTQGLARVYELISEHGISTSDVSWVTYRRSLAEDVLDRLVNWGILQHGDISENAHKGVTKHITTAHAQAYRIADNPRFKQWDTPRWSDYQDFMLSQFSMAYATNDQNTPDYGELLFSVYYWLINNEKPMSAAHEAPGWSALQSGWSSHPSLDEFESEWESYKRDNKLVDFYEFLTFVLSEGICPPTSTIVVDEYHDVYPLMDSVCKMWMEAADTSIVLGDPQQVVNHHEGARSKFFTELDLPEIKLQKTWRVPEPLWNAATSVLSRSHTAYTPEFQDSVEGTIESIRAPQMDYNKHTETWMTPTGTYGSPDELASEHADKSTLYLARTQRQIRGITATFEKAGVIYRSQVGADWRDDERRRHLYNALQRLKGISVEKTGHDEYEIVWADHADDIGIDTSGPPQSRMLCDELSAILKYTPTDFLSADRIDADTQSATLALIDDKHYELDDIAQYVNSEFWTEMTRGASSTQYLVNREGTSALDRDVIHAALVRNSDPTFSIENGEYEEEDSNKVTDDGLDSVANAMTMHASKGSEADVVIIYDGITSKIRQSIRRDREVAANEDRLWYVALTRAEQSAIIARDAFWWTDDYLPHGLSNQTTAESN
jgi:DNA helicase-2/ATP-dependent DNA helicase PcrA